jgi:hypothetical protein
MRLIATRQGKGDKYDTLRCIRRDGSWAETLMPRQGILPHDLVHYVVESALRYRHGFLGLVAAGADIKAVMVDLHDPHNREIADEATYAEAIVESLQAQLWSGAFDPDAFAEGARGACAQRGRNEPDLSGIDPRRELYDAVLELNGRWQQLPWHGALELEMAHL